MTSPASFNTPVRVITYAMRDAGLLQEGDNPNGEQLAEYSERLNDLINYLVTQGLKLWVQQDLSIPLTAGQNMYTIGPGGSVNMTKPLRVLQGYYNDLSDPTNPTRRPIYPLSWQEWLSLSNVTTQGSISQYFVDKQQLMLNVYFWNTPDSIAATNGTAQLLVENQITNFTGITDLMNFPNEWFLALRWGLADEICTGQPLDVQQRCQQRAEKFRMALEDWDVEDASTFFRPDSRGGNTGSKFR